jgi:uncharacterized protein YbjT (DUF2867 family)
MAAEHFNLSSNSIVTVLGGNGFVGQHIVREIAKTGAIIKVVGRYASDAKHLSTAGYVGQIAFMNLDLNNEKNLENVIKRSDVVINTLGLLYQRKKQNFENIHVKLAKNIARLCTEYGVKRFIHISALGIDKAVDSRYAKTKLAGETAIDQYYQSAIIIRPSVIFGAEDNFINMFSFIARISPFIPLIGGGKTKFQPVYVQDVAKAVVNCLSMEANEVCGKTFELGGPKIYTLKEIIELILKITKRKRILVNVPFALAKVKAWFLEWLPKPLLTRDQVTLLKYNNILHGTNGLKSLKVNPTQLETILPMYLKD